MIASHDVNALTGAFHLRGPAQDNGITPFDFSFEHLSFSSVVSRATSAGLRHLARVIGFYKMKFSALVSFFIWLSYVLLAFVPFAGDDAVVGVKVFAST